MNPAPNTDLLLTGGWITFLGFFGLLGVFRKSKFPPRWGRRRNHAPLMSMFALAWVSALIILLGVA